jgi:hypothetical protein
MSAMKSIFFLFILLTAKASFAADTWARFTCYLEINNGENVDQSQQLILDIGTPDEGWPLVALSVNGEQLQSLMRQYQFELYRQKPEDDDFSVRSHLVWLEKVDPVENSRNSDFNRKLSVANIETEVKVEDQIETRIYKVTKLTTNVDAENPSFAREVTTYRCEEPQVF